MRFFKLHFNKRQYIDPNKPKKGWKLFVWGLALLVVGSLTWVFATGYFAYKNINVKNAGDAPLFFKYGEAADPNALGAEGDSRINVLLLGIDTAAGLTDSIQIVSYDPINKSYAMMSLPRDLAVTTPGAGRTKINSVYNNGKTICTALKNCPLGIDQGAYALEKTIKDITGVKIHYFVKTDFLGLKNIVDNLGGIEVYVDKSLYDTSFPADSGFGYQTVNIKAGQQRMNGATALKYSRSRHSTSDFDRARRQQIVISAIKDKALSLGTLSNPKKITDLMNTLGQHIKTNISVGDISKFAALIKSVDSNKTATEVLDTSADGPLRNGTDSSLGYIIYPKKGANDFSEVKNYVLTIFKEPYILKENAKVVLVNATGKTASGKTISDLLKGMGYNIVQTVDATKSTSTTSISESSSKPYTSTLLKKHFSATVAKNNDYPSADIVLTIGTGYKLN
jgi:LCP family protein required for cell wall assembly